MNHRTVETTHPASESGSALVHVAIPHAQLSARKDTGLEGSAADSLLAAILVYYKDVMGNNLSPIYPPPFLQELRAFGRAQPPQEADLLSLDVNGSLERITKSTDTWNDTRNDLSIVDKIFYTIVSLRWAELTLAESIEHNAKAVLNVMIASVAEGFLVEDCDRFLLLCTQLVDSEGCYPLRKLVTSICLEIICVGTLPLFARTSMLRFILGPAIFILHHLETRIRLSEKISLLLQENSFEDMEFRSLVQRAARKCGLVQPALAFEELKSKVYLYLDDVIRDPLRYSQPEQISAYMPTMQWKNTLDHDLVFYLYLTNHKYQMLLFLEALRVLSIEYAIFSPSSLQKAILDEKDFNDQAIGMLYSSYQRVASRLDICLNMPASQHVGEHLDIVLEIVWEDLQPGSSIQTCLSDALVKLTKPSAVDVDQMLDLIRQMLHTSNVIPFEVIPSTLWIAAVCLHALDSWQEDTGAFSSKIKEGTAMCLDIFLLCILSSNRHSSSSSYPPQPDEDAANMALFLLTTLLPSEKAGTWRCVSLDAVQGTAEPSVFPDFLLRLFKNLIPLLERAIKDNSSSKLILAGALLKVLSIRIPTEVVDDDATSIAICLKNVADLQRDSTLRSSHTWQTIFEGNPHPLPALQSRVDAVICSRQPK